jgi:acyl carrier protein
MVPVGDRHAGPFGSRVRLLLPVVAGTECPTSHSAKDLVKKGSVNMSEVADKVKNIVIDHLGVDADKVTLEASFIEDLGADSLDTVELVMAFEEAFGVEIPDDAAETILTVGDAVKFLEKATA